ncbi:response regulator transcription factor [Nevskia soli]|uniref:response regulator transcription factor n=1 Tax=Nevskia soli TaxID=418856 RepID=UPI0015D8851E|nr:response regulator transcription factor [Nevskia soli]
MITVLVGAPSTVVRAGLEALARSHPGIEVVGSAALGEELQRKAIDLLPDVVLADADGHGLDLLPQLQGAAVLLVSEENALQLIRAGARGVLPHGASSREIGLAIEAVAAGLIVTHPEALDSANGAIPAATPGPLTHREIEVLRMLSEGLANKEIAWRLKISEHTVKFHVSSLFQKLNASSRTEAVTMGVRQGLIML